jgi:hypothetical protein
MRLHEFEIISDVQSTTSKPKILTKNDKIKKLFNLDEITAEEFIDGKTGKHVKKYCVIHDLNNTAYKVNTPYETVKNIILNKTFMVQGFASKSKNKK